MKSTKNNSTHSTDSVEFNSEKLKCTLLLFFLTAWVQLISAMHGHLTKMNHFHFENCSDETVLTDAMIAMIPEEAEEVHLTSCPRVASIPSNVCDGHPKLEGIVMNIFNRITNKTFDRPDCVKYLTINFSDGRNAIIEREAIDTFNKLKRLYLNGIPKSRIPAYLLDGHIPLVVDEEVLPVKVSFDVTIPEGTSVSGYTWN